MANIHTFVQCKFGDVVVDATYVTCTEHRVKFDQKEARHKERVSLKILCFDKLSAKVSLLMRLQSRQIKFDQKAPPKVH